MGTRMVAPGVAFGGTCTVMLEPGNIGCGTWSAAPGTHPGGTVMAMVGPAPTCCNCIGGGAEGAGVGGAWMMLIVGPGWFWGVGAPVTSRITRAFLLLQS